MINRDLQIVTANTRVMLVPPRKTGHASRTSCDLCWVFPVSTSLHWQTHTNYGSLISMSLHELSEESLEFPFWLSHYVLPMNWRSSKQQRLAIRVCLQLPTMVHEPIYHRYVYYLITENRSSTQANVIANTVWPALIRSYTRRPGVVIINIYTTSVVCIALQERNVCSHWICPLPTVGVIAASHFGVMVLSVSWDSRYWSARVRRSNSDRTFAK